MQIFNLIFVLEKCVIFFILFWCLYIKITVHLSGFFSSFLDRFGEIHHADISGPDPQPLIASYLAKGEESFKTAKPFGEFPKYNQGSSITNIHKQVAV